MVLVAHIDLVVHRNVKIGKTGSYVSRVQENFIQNSIKTKNIMEYEKC